jgi:hypothetical protein
MATKRIQEALNNEVTDLLLDAFDPVDGRLLARREADVADEKDPDYGRCT